MLGQGGFATIYKVRHRTLGYVRAIKVSQRDIDNENDKAYQTFLKECRILLKIGNGAHPNIVRIYQPRLIDNKALVEMDYVRGCTLNQYLSSIKFMPIDEVMRLIQEIGSALAYCHHDIYLDQLNPLEDHLKCDPDDATHYIINDAKRKELIDKYRVIHNDLHSNNIMRRDYDGGFVLLDFGLAIQDNRAVKSSSRQDGAIEYISPEKWDNENAITTQSDIYSLGIIIYEALTGHVPFVYDPDKYTSELQAKTDMSNKHHNVTPPEIGTQRMAAFKLANEGKVWEKDYPDWLEQMVMICLAKAPVDRYADAKEFMNDFNRHLAEDQAAKIQEEERKAENQEQAQQLQHKLDEMKSSLNKTQEQLVVTQTKAEDLERDLNLAKDKQTVAEKTIQSLDEEKTHLATENENLRKTVSKQKAYATENEELRKKVSELTERLTKGGVSKKPQKKVKRMIGRAGLLALLALAFVLATSYAYSLGVDKGVLSSNISQEVITADNIDANMASEVVDSEDALDAEPNTVSKEAGPEDVKETMERLDQANRQIAELEETNKKLQTQLEASQDKNSSTDNNAELARLKNQMAALSKENTSLKSKVSSLQSQNNKLQDQVNAFIKNLSN